MGDRQSIYAEVHVVDTVDVSPRMRRITFGGDGLAGFRSVAPDQFVKLFFAPHGQPLVVPELSDGGDLRQWRRDYLAIPEPERPRMRTYTVRRHLPDRRQVEIDFARHDDQIAGPAGRWAATARVGDVIGLRGPAPSHRRGSGDRAWQLFVGDETALPAIGALVESLGSGERAVVYAEVHDHLEQQRWETAGDVEVHWAHRADRSGRCRALFAVVAEQLRTATFPPGPVAAWIAGEASAARSLRRYLLDERGIDKAAVAISAYWRAHQSEDDPLTPEDAAERSGRRGAEDRRVPGDRPRS